MTRSPPGHSTPGHLPAGSPGLPGTPGGRGSSAGMSAGAPDPGPGALELEPVALVRARAQGRIRVVAGILVVMMLGSAARGVQLIADPAPETLAIATDKRWASVTIQGPRGEIRDASGEVLASSVPTPAVFIDPQVLRERAGDLDALTTTLSEVLDLPLAEVQSKIASKGRYVRLHRGVHPSVAEELRQLGLTSGKGLIVEDNWRRYYPQGPLAGQTIGYVDQAGAGVQGLEAWFDAELAGIRRYEQRRVDRRGNAVEVNRHDNRDVQGMSVTTTLDRDLQHLTEKALQGVIERHAPKWASAVLIEVRTGRVLAMATAPTFDPNRAGDEDYEVMRNRAVMDAIEPGSVFKPFSFAAAIEEQETTPDEMMNTSSPFLIGGARIRDDHPHPRMRAADILKYSSNVGSAQLAQRLGSSRLLRYYEAFGFGAPTGVQVTHEAAGRRSPSRVGPVELSTIAYGQGVTATVLQLASATATIANDGVRMQPLLVARVEDPWGEVRQAWEPTRIGRVLSSSSARQVAEAMSHVTEPDSTAPRAAVPGYSVAGKTGTAYKVVNGRYSPTARFAGFVGFAPASHPELAMAILVDEPSIGSRYGGVVAGPVFAEVMGPSLRALGVPPDLAVAASPSPSLPELVPPPAPVVVAWRGDAWRMPDLQGRDLRAAVSSLQGAGLNLDIQGSGVLVAQVPAAGLAVRPGETVSLRFE